MTIDEATDSIWRSEDCFNFWHNRGDFIIHEDWGRWMYRKKRGGSAYFLPDDMTGDELHALIRQCEKDGSDKALIARLKDFPVPGEEEIGA